MFNFTVRLASIIIYQLAKMMGIVIGNILGFLWFKAEEKIKASRNSSKTANTQGFTAEPIEPQPEPQPAPRILIPAPDGKEYMTDGHDIRLKLTQVEFDKIAKGEDPFVGEWN